MMARTVVAQGRNGDVGHRRHAGNHDDEPAPGAGASRLANVGTGPATIGNIVVNLQHRVGNKWVTVASDIANATEADAATTAVIHAAASSEGARFSPRPRRRECSSSWTRPATPNSR